MLVKKVGHEIKMARTDLGMSQKELSEKSGVAQKTISRVENAECDVCFETFSKIVEALPGYVIVEKFLIKKDVGV